MQNQGIKFEIGTAGSKRVKVDAMILADTRGLICASSGAGKSWILRLIAESVASTVQTVIIDPEGEFATLRERLDLLIVGENGDLRADLHSAGLLARKLAETGVSAVLDLYDLPGKGDPWVKRRMFVAQLISELMNLPKKLWHPMLIMVDEAHQFAQEETTSETYILNGARVAPALLSRSAIRSLMSAGRKRGIGGILATQRISKIDKDAIADARNVFIGGTTLDIDQRRAGDILGMSKAESVALRDLAPGVFYAFGPAVMGQGIVQFQSAQVQTTHPKAGRMASSQVPKASSQIAGIVAQFGDLPAVAEEQAVTLEAVQRENAELRRQLRERQVQVRPEVQRVEVPVLSAEQMDQILRSLADLGAYAQDVKAVAELIASYPLTLQPIAELLNAALQKMQAAPMYAGLDRAGGRDQTVKAIVRAADVNRYAGRSPIAQARESIARIDAADGMTGPRQRILDALAWLESVGLYQPIRSIVAFLAGYTVRSTSFTNPLGALRSSGMIAYPSSKTVSLTDAGRARANPQPRPQTTAELHQVILERLPDPQCRILRLLIEAYPQPIERAVLAERAGYTLKSTSFTNPLGALRSLGVIDYPSAESAVALPVLFLER